MLDQDVDGNSKLERLQNAVQKLYNGGRREIEVSVKSHCAFLCVYLFSCQF